MRRITKNEIDGYHVSAAIVNRKQYKFVHDIFCVFNILKRMEKVIERADGKKP